MGRKRTPGLYNRKGIWHIDKQIFETRICESTGTSSLEEAEKFLAKRIDQLREAKIYGIRPKRTFREAMIKYLEDNHLKASLEDEAIHLEKLDPFIGDLTLEEIHDGTLQSFINTRKKTGGRFGKGCASRTINLGLGVVRHILNLAASKWRDQNGLTWLHYAPKISMLPMRNARPPYPISWEEQKCLFNVLPVHLRRMALFKVNTGCREQEVCQLRWQWEQKIPELNTSVFIIPAYVVRKYLSSYPEYQSLVKNGQDRLVILNDIAKAVIEEIRYSEREFVFNYEYRDGKYRPVKKINNTAWQNARQKVGLEQVRVHDLKHTFGARLRAAGVSFEDMQDLLGHKSGRITMHYASASIPRLLAAANKICDQGKNGEITKLTLLRSTRKSNLIYLNGISSRKSPARDKKVDESVEESAQ